MPTLYHRRHDWSTVFSKKSTLDFIFYMWYNRTIFSKEGERRPAGRLKATMEFTTKCYERSAVVRAVCAFQESVLYPIVLAPLCVISGMSTKEIYLPILVLICLSILFSALFARDTKVLLPPIFMGYYALGNDDSTHLEGGKAAFFGDFDTHVFWIVALIVAVMVLVRFASDGTFTHLKHRRGAFLGGIIALDVAFLLNGVLHPDWRPRNLVYAFTMIFGFTFFYLVFFSIFNRTKNASRTRFDELTVYACVCVMCAAAVVLLQLLLRVRELYVADELLKYTEDSTVPTLMRHKFRLAWGGYATNIAAVIALGIPPCMYLARKCRFVPLFVGLALVFYGGACLTGTRSTMLVGAFLLLLCMILNCANGQNCKQHRLIALALLLVAFVALIYVNRHARSVTELLERFLEFTRLEILGDFDLLDEWIADKKDSVNSRLNLWRTAWSDFKSAPIFGVGFRDGSLDPKAKAVGLLNNMYHNFPIQFLGSMGVFGFAALTWHVVDLGRVLFNRFSMNKALLLTLPLLILGTSLLDNFFFFLNFQIIYCAALALAEHCSGSN